MVSRNGRFVIVYNGEAYNLDRLRIEVEAAHPHHALPWRGHSDTEVLLEGFAAFGSRFLTRVDGMFALAVYDARDRTLVLTRDRAGIKPLYVWQGEGLLLFASEAKLFFQHPAFRAAVDPDGLAAFFTYGHSTGACRMLKGLRQLEPGELLCLRDGVAEAPDRICPRPVWRHREWTDAEAIREIQTVLPRVVERQLVADVPVGVLLSGGVDSSILTALSARSLGPSRTPAFTLVYPEFGKDFNELEAARAVARHLGVQHHVLEARASDLIGSMESLVWHYDEPFADAAALNVMALSRLVREHVTVALAGEGSDELFGGYRRYRMERGFWRFPAVTRQMGRLSRMLGLHRARRIPRRLQILLRVLSHPTPADRYSAYFESGANPTDLILPPWRSARDSRATLRALFDENLASSPVAAMCLADQRFWLPDTYLEKSDKGSMAHSLELRVPFLDNEVIELANSLPDRMRVRRNVGKWLLRQAFRDLVPPGTFERFKRGFSVPLESWFRGELGRYFADRVLRPSARCAEYLDLKVLDRLHSEHAQGAFDRSNVLWQALLFEVWLETVAEGFRGPLPSRVLQ